MATANKLTVTGETIARHITTAAGSELHPDITKAPAHVITPTNWVMIKFSPTATSGNIDIKNDTNSGITLISDERSMWGEYIGEAKFFRLTARRKDGTSAAIVDNLIIITVNSVEIGRIYVDGANEKFGEFKFALPENRTDTRVNVAAGGTNGRFNFTATAADASLEVSLEVAGDI